LNGSSPRRERLLARAIFLGLLAVAAVLSLRIRFRAWPEVLVPSYLCGRGWMLYRDVKVVHSPLLIGFVAAVSRAFGLGAPGLRILGFLPVAGVVFALGRQARARGWSLAARVSAALYFILIFFVWDGNAIYPEVFLAALAIPIFAELRRGEDQDVRRAGWLFGIALMVKQPSLFALVFAAAWIFFRRREHLRPFVLRAAAAPAACLLFFVAAGAGRDFLRWTLVIPFVAYRGKTTLGIQSAQAGTVLAGILPLLLWAVPAIRREHERSSSLLLTGLIATFAMPAFPHFEMVHLVAAVPLLAVVAGEAVAWKTCEGGPGASLRDPEGKRTAAEGRVGLATGPPRLARGAAVAVGLSIFMSGAYLATDSSAGEMSFWSSKQNEAVLSRLAELPPAPLFLYGLDQNLFVRSGRLPPGGLYSNPDLWYHYLVDDLEGRQARILRDHPETIVLKGTATPAETPHRLLPNFLATHYWPEEFIRGAVERLRPQGSFR
jgi:hypothetical protein